MRLEQIIKHSDALEKENKKLREALEWYEDVRKWGIDDYGNWVWCAGEPRKKAQEALRKG